VNGDNQAGYFGRYGIGIDRGDCANRVKVHTDIAFLSRHCRNGYSRRGAGRGLFLQSGFVAAVKQYGDE
jgi:hypothetical protein